MTLLWPELPRKSAQDNLRQTLYYLRRTIPEVNGPDGDPIPFILSDRKQVQINPEAHYQLDVADFIALIEEGQPEQLAAAVKLYRDGFLANFYLEDSNQFENWAAVWRGRLQREALEALDRLAAYHLDLAQSEQAAACARRALEIDSLRESAHRQLILALSQMGKRVEAIRQYETCRALLRTELNVEPAAETEEAAAFIRRREWAARRRPRLPVPDTPLIGREKEMAEVTALLRNGVRLVSIVAPGGMGKSRLALEVAQRLAPGADADHPGAKSDVKQVTFVNLAPLSETAELVPAIGRALDLEFVKGSRVGLKERLLDYLRDKVQLLVLDNFEHLLAGSTIAKEILQASPGMKLLVTSRERLKLQAEHVYLIGGLAYSEWTTPVEASRDPAVKLFRYHARRARPAFTIRTEHLTALREIMRLTEGMPLALIMAAGWVPVLSLPEIAAEIDKSLGFLATTHRDIPDRQQSLRAVFGATWQRLSQRERRYFAAFSVFRGGFTRTAAVALTGAKLVGLLQLVDHSLVTRRADGRFEIHELLRQFAAEKLSGSGQPETVQYRHSQYYLTILASHLPALKGDGQLEAVDDIETDYENLQVAWRWACRNDLSLLTPEAGLSLLLYCFVRSRSLDGIDLVNLAYQEAGDRPDGVTRESQSYLMASLVLLLLELGRLEDASAVMTELADTVDDLAEPRTRAYCRLALGEALRVTGHIHEAIEHLQAALAYYQQAQDDFFAGFALGRLGWATYRRGHSASALQLQRRGLARARHTGNYFLQAELLRAIGAMIWMVQGLTLEAEAYQTEAAHLQQEMGARAAYAYNLSEIANMPVWRKGETGRAAALLNEALAIAREQNVPYVTAHVMAEMTTLRLIEGQYDQAMALTEKVLAETSPQDDTWTWARYQQGIALLGLGQIEQAVETMKLPLSRMVKQDWSGLLRDLIAFAGVVLAEQGEEEWAVALLAHGLTHPQTPGRLEVDPLITRYRDKLEASLGRERFAVAWKQGEQLETLEAAVTILEYWELAC